MFPSIRGLFPFIPGYFHYISIVLQAIGVLQCVRKGTQQKWIWLIVFLPFQYGMFLLRAGREEEARHVFADIADEAFHLSSRERRYNRTWILKAKQELKRA